MTLESLHCLLAHSRLDTAARDSLAPNPTWRRKWLRKRSHPPHIFDFDRLPTPIGVALLVTDTDGVLCALDWEDDLWR
jgi:hypothetical protein